MGGSDGNRWNAVGTHRQRLEEMGGGGEAQAAMGRDGRRWGGTGSGGEAHAVVHWTEAVQLLIDRRKGIK